MIRKTIAAILVVLPGLCSASTYDCSVKRRGAAAEKPKEIWAGKIVLKDGPPGAVEVLVLEKDGKAVPVADIAKNAADDASVRAAMKPYDGLPVIGLRRQTARGMDLNLGHVDVAHARDSAPMDVDAWASLDSKEIGVTDVRTGLTALCRLE